MIFNNLNSTNDNSVNRPQRRVVRRKTGKNIQNEEDTYFRNIKVLNGNIGHFQIVQIPFLEFTKSKVDEIFRIIKNTDALIIDLRNNPGGIGGFIPYLMSYLFQEKEMELFQRNFIGLDSISVVKTERNIPFTYNDKPVYILVNEFTGSAATNLAYTLQQFKRAEIIGEPSGVGSKGANSAMVLPLSDGFIATIPSATIINKASGTNWNNTGLLPDYRIPSDEAFKYAYKKALENTNKVNIELTELEPKDQLHTSDEAKPDFDFSLLEGEYEGGRTISLVDGKLMFQRGSFPKMHLKYLGNKIFELQLPNSIPNARKSPNFRFDFKNNKVEKITYLFEDGSTDQALKIKN